MAHYEGPVQGSARHWECGKVPSLLSRDNGTPLDLSPPQQHQGPSLKLSFSQLVADITHKFRADLTFQASVLAALEEKVKVHLIGLFKDTHLCAFHVK